jgi:5'(3')-deoxyribonucleotidase
MAASKKQIIAVDIDDVLAQGTESLRLEVNKRLGVHLLPEHYQVPGPYWGYYEQVWETHGLADRITMAELNPQMEQDQSHVPAVEGARDALLKLKSHYELVVVTSRESSWQAATTSWLDVQFPQTFSQVLFTNGRAGLKQKNKGQICKEISATWLIDDNVEHAKTALAEGVRVVLFGDYGWHQDVPEDIVACKDWNAVVEYFDGR